MPALIEKLIRLLNLEISKHYDNRAVIGGLQKFVPTWQTEASKAGLDQKLILKVSDLILQYAAENQDTRQKIISDILAFVQNEQNSATTDHPASISSGIKQNHAFEKSHPAESPLSVKKLSSKPKTTQTTNVSETIPGLNAPLTVLTGIGASRAQALKQLGLFTLGDVLYFFPRRYDDYSKLKPINRLNYGDEITVIAVVQSIQTRKARGGTMQITEAVVTDGTSPLRLNWFNNPYIEKQLSPGTQIVISGKVDMYLGRLIMNHPSWEPLEKEHLHTNRIVPVYPLTANMTQRTLRSIIYQIVDHWASRIPEFIPDQILKNVGLITLSKAIAQVHFPESDSSLAAARNRLAFDEIFLMQLGVMQQKQNWQGMTSAVYSVQEDWLQRRIDALSYKLTQAQSKSLKEIRKDMESGHPMNRLLQGDVGSGKTIIAALAISIINHSDNTQSAFLAPTGILAEQHYKTLINTLCRDFNFDETDLKEDEICLLIGDTPEPEKATICQKLSDGRIKTIVGTHALLQEPVAFRNLQLVIIDEQHRFGTEQRAILRSKGNSPHLMVMTATPIPRSLALTMYGDLDISVIDELPTGRIPIDTHVLFPAERERAYTLIKNQVEQGFQAFIIYPLIEKNEKEESKAAVDEQKRLQNEVFPHLQIGLLHGRMKQEEKDRVMQDFRDNKFPVLVSTTVIEVGVDIPNATVMLIEGANRFGLAQLHQLRGRVGRSDAKSYCLLIPESDDQIENERLSAMAETNNGFILAERDLQQRGPGEFLGERQSGFAQFKMASISDIHLIEKAREQAQYLFSIDPDLSLKEHQALKNNMEFFWSNKTTDIS